MSVVGSWEVVADIDVWSVLVGSCVVVLHALFLSAAPCFKLRE